MNERKTIVIESEDLIYLEKIIKEMLQQDQVVAYTITGKNIEEIIEDEYFGEVTFQKHSEPIPVTMFSAFQAPNSTLRIQYENIPLILAIGDIAQVTEHEILFFQKKDIKKVYVFERKMQEKDLIKNAYNNHPH